MTNTELIFKKNLIYLRNKNHVSAYHVAKAADITLSYYYRLEDFNLSINPRFTTFEKIASYYNIEVYELLKRQYE